MPTSATHVESQLFEQQYESFAQTCVAHGSQLLVSFVPALQIAWLHVPPPPPLVEHVDSPHTDDTSATHTLLHAVVQQ